MTAPQQQPGQQTIDPMFVWVEMTRRTDALSTRLDHIDASGTRGVDGLRAEVRALAADLVEHEKQHAQAAADQRTFRRWAIGLVTAGIAAMLSNPFLVLVLTRGK